MRMCEIEIESFNEKLCIERVLGQIKGTNKSPTIIVIAGIHGNEMAGIFAIKKILEDIDKNNINLSGNLYAISGNLNALQKNIRYDKADLNRIWTQEKVDQINTENTTTGTAEVYEQQVLFKLIKKILATEDGPFYFMDLHTTSSDTIPFITISDSLNNRKFSSKFSLPIVLGIEEYLDGPLLTYINEFGHIALGFEAGQHNKKESVFNCEAFIWLALEASGCLEKSQIPAYNEFKKKLISANDKNNFYEIDYRYQIDTSEDFKMLNGFKNFEKIAKNQPLALSDNNKINASMNGLVFMPLYQKQGDDGFFIINPISKFWLNFSKAARKLKMYHLLRILPGIKMDPIHVHTLIVNPKTARFLALEIFHLFGYRKQVIKDNKLHFIKRDREVSDF